MDRSLMNTGDEGTRMLKEVVIGEYCTFLEAAIVPEQASTNSIAQTRSNKLLPMAAQFWMFLSQLHKPQKEPVSIT